MSARRWFHALLGAAFLPGLALPLVWSVAIREWRRAPGPDRRWPARLLALAVVDTLVLVALVVLGGSERELSAASSPARHPVIGVFPDRTSPGPELRLGSVTPGGPAAKAGLRAGDIIEEVDGETVSSFDELRREIGDASSGEPLELRVRRDGSVFSVEVTPVWSDQIPSPRRALFQPDPAGGGCIAFSGSIAWKPIVIEAALLAALAVAAGVTSSGAGVWLTLLAVLMSAGGALAGFVAPCLLLGGPSTGGVLLSMWGTSLGLGVVALAGRRRVPSVPFVASRSVSSTVLLGFWYAITGAIRLAIVLIALRSLLPSTPAPTGPVQIFASALQMGSPAFAMVAFGAVVLAPLCEELVFRGMLLPSLIPWVGATAALWIAAIVFGGLHWYYGVMTPVIVLFGWILGWARLASGGLRAPVVLHALMNLIPLSITALRR